MRRNFIPSNHYSILSVFLYLPSMCAVHACMSAFCRASRLMLITCRQRQKSSILFAKRKRNLQLANTIFTATAGAQGDRITVFSQTFYPAFFFFSLSHSNLVSFSVNCVCMICVLGICRISKFK